VISGVGVRRRVGKSRIKDENAKMDCHVASLLAMTSGEKAKVFYGLTFFAAWRIVRVEKANMRVAVGGGWPVRYCGPAKE
jgi:hypothetical protein